jgi:hypothetical protein
LLWFPNLEIHDEEKNEKAIDKGFFFEGVKGRRDL